MRDDMFFVGIQVQSRWTWAMFDTGASKNLVSTKLFGQLFHQPEFRAPGAMRILVGNGAALDLRGWTTLVVAIDGHWLSISSESWVTCRSRQSSVRRS